MSRRKLKKEEIRKDPIRAFLATAFNEIEMSLETHWKVYLAGFAVVILAVAGGYFYLESVKSKAESSSLLLSEIIDISEAPVKAQGDPSRENLLKSGMKVYATEGERSDELKKKISELQSKGATGDQERAALFLKAADLAKAGSYGEALTLLEAVGKGKHFESSALQLRARIYELQKDDAKAEAAYKELSTLKAVDLPEPMGVELLAKFYEKQGKKDEALKLYEQAVSVLDEQKKSPSASKAQPMAGGPGQSPGARDEMDSRIRERIKELKTSG